MSSTGMPPNTSGTGQMKEKIPSGYSKGSLQQFTPEQMQLFQQMFSHVGPDSFLSKLAGGDEDTFNQIEAPALKQFSALQGQIGSRFSGMGTGGQKSSGFQNTMNSAAQDFAGQLQSNRQSLQQQALKDLMGFSSNILGQQPYKNFLTKKDHKEPFWKQLLGMISPVGGDIASGGTQNTKNFFQALGMFTGGGAPNPMEGMFK
jgi:hypothetical protein